MADHDAAGGAGQVDVEDGGGADGDGEHSENTRSFSKKSFFYDEFYLLNISRDAKLSVPKNQYW